MRTGMAKIQNFLHYSYEKRRNYCKIDMNNVDFEAWNAKY